MLDQVLPPGSKRRSAAFIAAGFLALFAFTQLYLETPIAILFLGLCLGAVIGLTAAGIVLIYRTQRFVNFAQAAIGVAGGEVAFNLTVSRNFPFLAAILVGILAAILVGVVVEFAFIKRFAKQPRLVMTVVSIALAQAVPDGAQNVLRRVAPFIYPDADSATLEESLGLIDIKDKLPFQGLNFRIGGFPLDFGFAHIFALEAAFIGLLVLAAFFRFTRAGVAVRGVAENADRATLLGISVGSLSTIVWILAAALSGVSVIATGVLTTPAASIQGLTGAGSVFLPALAAAVLGRMRNIPTTMAAAIGIAIMRQSVELGRPDDRVLVDLALFVIIAGGLVFQRARAGRSEAAGDSTWAATQEQRPIPKELANVGGVRLTRIALPVVFGLAVFVFPFVATTGLTATGALVAITGIVALSLVVLTGWAGQVSLGQWAFVGIGAVVGGALIMKVNLPLPVAMVLTPVVTAAVAVIVGLPALRIKGLFLAVTTFAFAIAVQTVLFNDKYFGWLLPSDGVDRPQFFLVDFRSERSMYFLCVFSLGVCTLLVVNLRRSRFGRILIAARENETNLQSFGVKLVRTKLLAFAVSGALCGFAGVLYAVQQQGISDQSFGPEVSITVFMFSVLGGIGSISGVLLGGFFRVLTEDIITSDFIGPLVGPGGVLLILYMAPGGLISAINGARDAALRIVAQRRQIIVPSLFADMDPAALAARLIPLGDPIPNSGLAALGHHERYELDSEVVGTAARKRPPAVKPAEDTPLAAITSGSPS